MKRILRFLTCLTALALMLGAAAVPALAEGVTVEAHTYGQDFEHAYIPGATYIVTDYDGNLCGFTRTADGRYSWGGPETTLYTDADGVLIFSDIPATRLDVIQTSIPDGVYEVINDTITVWGTIDTTLNFFNQARTLKLKAQDDRTGTKLRTSFGLKKNGADVLLIKKSGSNY